MKHRVETTIQSVPIGIATRALLLCVTLLVAVAAKAPARAQDAQDLQNRAAAAMQASEWTKAAELYGQIVEAEPEAAPAWFRFGLATVRAGGDTDAARRAFDKAAELGFPAQAVQLGMAGSHAVDGDREAVFETLEGLAEQGPSSFVVTQLESDAVFESVRSDARYEELLTRLTPCATAEYRQFDFWLGKWDVVSPQGQPLGTNNVVGSLDGCMLIENWESASGGQKGMSINYYDRVEDTWTQIFRDNSGNIAQWPTLTGGIVDGSMVLESPADAQPRTRWKWTLGEDGRVRQMAESSSDSGETWTVVWDSYYVRAD